MSQLDDDEMAKFGSHDEYTDDDAVSYAQTDSADRSEARPSASSRRADPVDDGGYAFPVPMVYDGVTADSVNERGMSLRDYFAAKALSWQGRNPKQTAEWAYKIADAMIVERAKGGR